MIPKKTIEEILDKADIVKVIGEFVPLKKKGINYMACCPFHNENKPSFAVFPHYGVFKCFSCGKRGDVVGFLMKHENMTYPEALHWLAGKYGIEIKERVPTADEVAEQAKKDSMWASYAWLSNEYAKQIFLPENKHAFNYALRRWGEEYIREAGIGYCPEKSKIVDNSQMSEDLAELMHIRNKAGYDFFSGRITIPIIDKQQHVIGFTARALDPKAEAKYMNSKESLVFSKSKTLFGIDKAWRVGCRQGRFFLVEGAPDCMRLQIIGVANTVAPLGTALTIDHLQLLRKAASHLCFLPDADPPKEGEQFGPGIKAVIKSGTLAMQNGFTVSVKQIPVLDEKQDPDTYCTTMEAFESIDEKDFVLWLASLLFKKDMTTDEKSRVVAQIVDLLSYLTDETAVDMYITTLTQYDVGKRVWDKALNKRRNDRIIEEKEEKQKKESDLYRKYGFNVDHNKYFSISDKGGEYVWSNFIMRPMFHIKDAVNPKRLFVLKNESGHEEVVELKQEDLVSLSRFRQKIEGLGNFIWKATERELTKLKSYLYENTESAVEVTQLGWQSRAGAYAFGNGVLYKGQFKNVDDDGIVRLDGINLYLPAHSKIYRDETKLFQYERRFVHLNLSSTSLRAFTDQMFRVFGNNAKVAFCFLLATLFRDIVVRETRSFPILNIFGVKGSGKSELGHTLMSFFELNNIPPNIQNSTIPALNDTVAAVANGLVHIDEYKNDLDITKNEFLKGLWDGTGRTRKNMDLDKKTETTSVDAGIILSGQDMPTADIALFSRLIFLAFQKTEFSEKAKEEFQVLKRMRSVGMTHLTIELLKLRDKVESDFREQYAFVMKELNARLEGMAIEDRIQLNWQGPLAVLRCLESDLDIDITYREMLDITVQGIINQNSYCKQNNELAGFWKMVMFLADEGELAADGDFRICYVTSLKTNRGSMKWPAMRPVLYMQKSRIFKLYKKHGKMMGEKSVSEESLEYYLVNSKEYYGEKKGVRFKCIHKGVLVYEMDSTTGRNHPVSKVMSAMSFDYERLRDNYSVDLEYASSSSGDSAEEEEDEETPPLPDPRLPFGDD